MDEDIEALDERTEDNRKDCDHILDSLKVLEDRVASNSSSTAAVGPSASGLRQEIEAGLRQEIHTGLRKDIEAGLRQEMHGRLRQEMEVGLRQEVNGHLRQELEAGLRQEIHGRFRQDLEAGLRQEINGRIRKEIEADLRQEVNSGLRKEIEAGLRQELHSDLRKEVEAAIAGKDLASKPDLARGLKTIPFGLSKEEVSQMIEFATRNFLRTVQGICTVRKVLADFAVCD